jgi:hypothetical protein
MLRGIVLLLLAHGVAGCGGSGFSSVPSAPSPVLQPAPIELVVFTDPASGFSTSDVRDVQEQIVRFNTAAELIWTIDGTRFPGHPVNGNLITYDRTRFFYFQVRFGIKDGERRAYLSWYDDLNHYYPGTIVDIGVDGDGHVVVTETNVPVPGN